MLKASSSELPTSPIIINDSLSSALNSDTPSKLLSSIICFPISLLMAFLTANFLAWFWNLEGIPKCYRNL